MRSEKSQGPPRRGASSSSRRKDCWYETPGRRPAGMWPRPRPRDSQPFAQVAMARTGDGGARPLSLETWSDCHRSIHGRSGQSPGRTHPTGLHLPGSAVESGADDGSPDSLGAGGDGIRRCPGIQGRVRTRKKRAEAPSSGMGKESSDPVPSPSSMGVQGAWRRSVVVSMR